MYDTRVYEPTTKKAKYFQEYTLNDERKLKKEKNKQKISDFYLFVLNGELK